MKFRKKPVVIEAIQWDELRDTFNKLTFMGMKYSSHKGHRDRPEEVRDLRIKTLEGSINASKGDWIIKGVKGEFYPCKPDIFEATYDAVTE